MMYEVFKVANGYMLRPTPDHSRGTYSNQFDVYVFNDYSKMADKLHELLNQNDHERLS